MSGHKILIFGDSRHLFRTIRWALEYKGYDVSSVPRPEADLALLIEQDYDLVIVRLSMEDLPSLDVLKRARELNPEVGIMVVSVDGNAAFPLETYQIEVDDYLLLPVSPSELWRRVGQCLKKVAASRAAKASSINAVLANRIMIMLHDTRGALVSIAASLKLLRRGRFGNMAPQAAAHLEELSYRMQGSADVIDDFAHELLPHSTAAKGRVPWHHNKTGSPEKLTTRGGNLLEEI